MTLKDTYYISPHYQDTESKQFYVMHGNKHREAAKMSRQIYMAQMKKTDQNSRKTTNKMQIMSL